MNNYIDTFLQLLILAFVALANAQLSELRQKYKEASQYATLCLVIWISCFVWAVVIFVRWVAASV